MIGEERALIQAGTNKETKEMESRKRQRKWNQERDKGNGTDMGCNFFKCFYFISCYALVSSFLTYILPVYCKRIKKLVAGAPDGGKKKTKEIERTCIGLLCHAVIFTIIFALFHFTH